MQDKKYVVKFKKKYIRATYSTSNYNHFPMLTPKPHLVDADCLFDTKEEANRCIKRILTSRKPRLKELNTECINFKAKGFQCINSKAKGFHRSNVCRWSDLRNSRNIERHRCNASNYSVEEYTPDFICNRARKKTINVWKDDASPKTFCSCCGSNIYYGDYAQIRQTKICPFCIKSLGQAANEIIEKHKKGDPDIETNYNCTVFLEHMD